MTSESLASLPSVRRQHLLTEFAGLKHACPEGVFVSLTPGDPSLWSAAVFIREGPYKTAVLRFQISFSDSYPLLPPLVTFSTDLFHPLITPLTTFMYTTDIQDNGTVSATDAERLPPGGFSLRHGFPEWFGRKSRMSQEAELSTSKVSSPKSDASLGYMSTSKRSIAVHDVLKYIRSTFTEGKVLDDIPLAAAGNPGAWHAWRAHRRKPGKMRQPVEDSREIQESAAAATPAADADADASTDADAAASDTADDTNAEAKDNETANADATNTGATGASDNTSLKQPGEWNWEGVWEDRVKKGIAMSLSEPVLYGGSTPTEELIRFLPLEEADIESIKENVRRILGESV